MSTFQINPFPGIDQYLELCSHKLKMDISKWKGEASTLEGSSSVLYLEEPSYDNKCLLNCMMLKAGVIDNNGTIQGAFISLPDPALCSNFTESDICERTYLIEKCIRKQLHLIPRI
ncbi:hypothetical protein Trydic_g6472 [Trypoxylus dichotomus]